MSLLGVAMQMPASGLGAARRRLHALFARFAAALAVFTALLAPLPALAAFTPPPLNGHVVDTAGKLTQADVLALDQKIDRIRRQTGFEVVAFVVGSLEGETIDDVAYKAFNTWGIGRKGPDNGVLLVIAPSERKVRIETGKGVGGALTDLQSNDIIRNVIAPLLQQERFREAIDQGTTAIAKALVAGTPENERPKPQPGANPQQGTRVNPLYVGGAILAVIILAIVSPAFRSLLLFLLQIVFFFGGRGGGGGGGGGGWGGSGYSGGGGRSGGGGSSDNY